MSIENSIKLQSILVVTLVLLSTMSYILLSREAKESKTPSKVELELISPLNNSILVRSQISLNWEIKGLVTDLNVIINSIEHRVSPNARSYLIDNFTIGEKVNWSIMADSINSDTWSFTINTPPNITIESQITTFNTTSPNVFWSSSDEDGQDISHSIRYRELGDKGWITEAVHSTSWQFENLSNGARYEWQALAFDGLEEVESDIGFFYIDHTERTNEVVQGLTLSQKIGQMIIGVASRSDESLPEVENMTRDGFVGGWLIRREETLTDATPILNFTNHLQNLSISSYGMPLLIVGDFEGGKIMTYASIMSQWSNLMTLGATRNEDLAYQFGLHYGSEIAALGFNMAFAPVLDVNTNPDNPVIGPRSFGSDPELVAKFGKKVIEGNTDAGIIATVKHFPGHGDTSVDSHRGLPILNFNRTRLENFELKPFRMAVEGGVPAIMTAHISIPELDPTGRPATLSKPILTDLLRDEMGFEGVIVTDSIGMKAISKNYGILEAAKLTFEAGGDILLFTGSNRTQLKQYHQFLMDEVEVGNLSHERINESVFRIVKMKLEYGLFDRYPVGLENLSIIRNPIHSQTADGIANESIVKVRNADDHIPLQDLGDESILVISPDNLKNDKGDLSLAFYLMQEGLNVSQYIISHQVTQEDHDEAIRLANESDVVIFASHNFQWYPKYYKNSQIDLGWDLFNLSDQENIPLIHISVENPYDLRVYPEFEAQLVILNSKETTVRALVESMMGRLDFAGQLPVEID